LINEFVFLIPLHGFFQKEKKDFIDEENEVFLGLERIE